MKRAAAQDRGFGRRGPGGFSLTEVIVVIAIIGILAALAIPQYSGLTRASADEVANQVVTDMNNAVKTYAQIAADITIAGAADAVTDEDAVMALLADDPSKPLTKEERLALPGWPYLTGARDRWPKGESADAKTYRARWNGRYFELLKHGVEGKGLLVN